MIAKTYRKKPLTELSHGLTRLNKNVFIQDRRKGLAIFWHDGRIGPKVKLEIPWPVVIAYAKRCAPELFMAASETPVGMDNAQLLAIIKEIRKAAGDEEERLTQNALTNRVADMTDSLREIYNLATRDNPVLKGSRLADIAEAGLFSDDPKKR